MIHARVAAVLVVGVLVVVGVPAVPTTDADDGTADRGGLTDRRGLGTLHPAALHDAAAIGPVGAPLGDRASPDTAASRSTVQGHWNLDGDPRYEVNSSDRVRVSQRNGTFEIALTLENGDGWTMVFDDVVEFGEESGLTVFEAIAGPDGRVSTPELVRAIEHWSNGTPVPDTGGETIETPELIELIDHWSEGTLV